MNHLTAVVALFLNSILTLCKILFLPLLLLREGVREEPRVTTLITPVQDEAGENNCLGRVYVHGKSFHIRVPTSNPEDLR